MPVRKFRSIEEMKADPGWLEPGSPELYRAMQSVFAFAARVCVHHFPPGVYRHRNVEEMNRQTERWDQANFEATQQLRKRARDEGMDGLGQSED